MFIGLEPGQNLYIPVLFKTQLDLTPDELLLWLRYPYAGLVAIAHHRTERYSEIRHVCMRDNTKGRKHLRLELLGRIVHHGPHIHTVCGRINRSAYIGNGGLEDLLRIRHNPDFDRLPNFDPRHVRLVDVGEHPHLRQVSNDEEGIGVILPDELSWADFARGNGAGQRRGDRDDALRVAVFDARNLRFTFAKG